MQTTSGSQPGDPGSGLGDVTGGAQGGVQSGASGGGRDMCSGDSAISTWPRKTVKHGDVSHCEERGGEHEGTVLSNL